MFNLCLSTYQYVPDIGGISKSVHRLASNLGRMGISVHVFTPLPRDEEHNWREPRPQSENINVHRVSRVGRITDNIGLKIREVDASLEFDVFHAFYLPIARTCLGAIARRARPLVVSIRGADGVNLYYPELMEILDKASWVTSVSRDSLNRVQAIANISNRSSFIANSIEAERFPRWTLRKQNKGVIGTVATFRRKKNIPLLIQSYSSVQREVRQKLLLVGDAIDSGSATEDAAERLRINNIIAAKGLGTEVEITGYVQNEHIAQHLLAMNVFVLSSDHEGLPNSILEAAAVGMPIVATAVDGVKDIFMDGVDALLVPPGDGWGLTRAIAQILSDANLAYALGDAARETALRLNPRSEAQEYLNIYEKFLK